MRSFTATKRAHYAEKLETLLILLHEGLLDRQLERIKRKVEASRMDKGYLTPKEFVDMIIPLDNDCVAKQHLFQTTSPTTAPRTQ